MSPRHFHSLFWRAFGVKLRSPHRFYTSQPVSLVERQNTARGPIRVFPTFLLSATIFAAKANYQKEEEHTPMDNLKSAMKLIRENKLSEAEKLIHKACLIAEHTKDVVTATTGYMLLGNLYEELNHSKKAESLYLKVLQNFLAVMKRPENDPAVLAVSLKLANIYYSWGDYDKAELGYKFCLDSQRKNYETSLKAQSGADSVETTSDDSQVPPSEARGNGMLLAHCANDYGKFLLDRKRLVDAEKSFLEGLTVIDSVIGDACDPLKVIIESNYSAVCIQLQKFDLALTHSEAALNHLNLLKDIEKGPITSALLVTYAEALFHRGFKKEAVRMAEGAVRAAKDDITSENAKVFLASIQKDLG